MKKGLLGLSWFAGTVFVVLIAFALLKPFIWHWTFNEAPTEITNTFSSLLTILIALLALGIGTFGGVTYHIVSRHIHDDIKKASEQEYSAAIVRLNSDICLLWGNLYEILMRILKKDQQISLSHLFIMEKGLQNFQKN